MAAGPGAGPNASPNNPQYNLLTISPKSAIIIPIDPPRRPAISHLHVTSPVGQFRAAFAKASGPAPARSPKAVLSNVLLSAEDGKPATLGGTDLEVGIVCDLSFVTILSPGRCLINAKNPSVARLAEAMASLPADATLDIRVDGDKILVSASGVKWKCVLPSEDPDLYPSIPGAETGRPFASVAGADLKRAIKRTGYAQDVTSTRYALGGSLAERDTERSTMILVATDGRRLVKVELPADFEPADESSTPAVSSASPVLSKRFLDLVSGLIDPDAMVGLRLDSNRAVIASQQGWSLYGRLVEGRFPRYQDVRPSDHDAVVRATITTADLLGAVGRVAAIACGEESRGLDLTWNEGGLDISGQSADHGQSDGWVAADYRAVADGLREVPEAGVGVTMDARFLVETLSAAAPETMEFRVIDHKNAVLLVGDDGALEVTIMPLTRDR